MTGKSTFILNASKTFSVYKDHKWFSQDMIYGSNRLVMYDLQGSDITFIIKNSHLFLIELHQSNLDLSKLLPKLFTLKHDRNDDFLMLFLFQTFYI